MKHFIHIQVTPQVAHDMQASPGGPGPAIGRIIERFNPETVYVSPQRRAIFMICELKPADMPELKSAGSAFAGQELEFIPVVEGKDFGAQVGKGSCPV